MKSKISSNKENVAIGNILFPVANRDITQVYQRPLCPTQWRIIRTQMVKKSNQLSFSHLRITSQSAISSERF